MPQGHPPGSSGFQGLVDSTIRYCYPFIAALVFVMLLLAFVPWTETYIPHRFLGP
jgi:hypothetical protein